MKTQIKYLGRIIKQDGMMPDPKAVVKLQQWNPPRNRSELSSFFGFTNYYREFIRDYAAIASPLTRMLRKNNQFEWTEEAQVAFERLKKALVDAQALTLPTEDGRFYLDTDASNVGISAILHQEQEWNGKKVLRPIYFGSKSLNSTQMKYGAPKLEMLAVVTFVKKFESFLAPRQFTLRVDNQALSWLKTYSMTSGLVGRWLMILDQFDMVIEHRPRHKHMNADGLSKMTNHYQKQERILAQQPEVRPGFGFMPQKQYEELPITPDLDKHGLPIVNRDLPSPEEPSEVDVYRAEQQRPGEFQLLEADDILPEFPRIVWKYDVDESTSTNNKVMRIVSYQDNNLMNKPTPLRKLEEANVRETLFAVTLRDHVAAQYKIQDLKAAQDADLSVNSLKKLLQNPKMKLIRLPSTLKESVLGYFKKRRGQLFVNPQGILCVKRTREEALRYSNDFMIVMPQL
ncbi:MAG: ribonuclease H family protein, partial [Bacteroidota bacterium]